MRAGQGVDGDAVFDRIEAELDALEQNGEARETYAEELRARIDAGLASLDRGEGVDGAQFMQQMLDELDAQESAGKG